LGEIESVLRQRDEVAEAVVIVREDKPGDRRLVGYIAANAGKELNPAEIKAYLKTLLPEYMVPTAIVILTEMPMSPNGKIDRRNLPEPEQIRPAIDTEYQGTSSALEQVLAIIWADILGIDRVGAQDNFFELGGHSLLATQLVSRIRKVFQMDIPLRRIFEAPTVRELAIWMEKGENPVRVKKTAELMLNLAHLSDEEAEKMLAEKSSNNKEK
jgi:acyl carrier protein